MRPFKENEPLSGAHLEVLGFWLRDHCDKELKLTPDYAVGDLIADLDRIMDGMWSDGIDAMGEDA